MNGFLRTAMSTLICCGSMLFACRAGGAQAVVPGTVTEPVSPSAGSIALPGRFGNMVLPSGGSAAGTVTLSTTLGAFPDAPNLPNDNEPAEPEGPSTIVESIAFTFDRDIVFPGYPSFELNPPATSAPLEAPFLLEIFDATTKTRLTVLPNMERAPLTYLGRYTDAFRAVKAHTYVAELVKSPFAAQYSVHDAPQTFAAPAIAGGTHAVFELPQSSGQAHAATALLVSSTTAPVGIPPLQGPFILSTPYFVNVVFSGAVQRYAGPAGVTFSLPPGSPAIRDHYGIAVYDTGRPALGWQILPVSPTMPSASQLHFVLPDVKFSLSIRPYAVALFVGKGPASTLQTVTPAIPAAQAGLKHRFTVAAIGGSELRLVILPGTPAPCSGAWGPAPQCQFAADPTANVPGIIARSTGARVLNFAMLGSQTVVDSFRGQSMLNEQVPQLPSDADVVVLNIGTNDLVLNGQDPATSVHVDEMTAAIRAKAPHARLIFLGLRCYIGCNPAAIDAWNAAERKAAARNGAWIDLRTYGPAHASDQFPDGAHPSLAAAERIGTDVAKLIRPWMAPKSPKTSPV